MVSGVWSEVCPPAYKVSVPLVFVDSTLVSDGLGNGAATGPFVTSGKNISSPTHASRTHTRTSTVRPSLFSSRCIQYDHSSHWRVVVCMVHLQSPLAGHTLDSLESGVSHLSVASSGQYSITNGTGLLDGIGNGSISQRLQEIDIMIQHNIR
jgi:hypothetical protein